MGAGRIALAVGLVTGAVGGVVLAEWNVAVFRTAMGWLAPRMALLLYGLAAVALATTIVRRIRPTTGRSTGSRPLDRCRFLAGPAAMTATILAFLVPLFGAWARGTRPPIAVAGITLAGIVPYSDGTLWFGAAERLLFNGAVDDYSAKRPLNPALLAVRLALTNMDLRLALVLQAVLVGVACCLLARVVARHLGGPAALALFAGMVGFTGLWGTTTYTEALGVTFGALAAAALWTALSDRDPRQFAAGLFLLTVALSVRAGAVFVVLLLPLWFARSVRGSDSRLAAWPVVGLGLAAVAAGLAVNLAASWSTGGKPADLNSNSTYMVYGLAMGYPGWADNPGGWGRVLVDHPELLPLDDSGRAVAVRRLAFQAVGDHPRRFVSSLVRGETNYLRLATRQAIGIPNLLVRRGVQAVALGLGALALFRRRREGWKRLLVDVGLFGASVLCIPVLLVWGDLAGLPGWLGGVLAAVSFCAFVVVGSAGRMSPAHAAFLLVATAGVVVSLPVIGFDTARVLAATAPLMALPLAVSVSVLARGRDGVATGGVRPGAGEPAPIVRSHWAPSVVGTALVAVALLGAPLAAAAVDKPPVARRVCPDGSPAQALLGTTSVRIVEDAAAGSGVDAIDVESATRELETIVGLAEVKSLIRPGTTIVAGQNEQGDDRIAFLIGSVRASGSSVVYFCGGKLGDQTSVALSYFWPKPVDFAFMTGTPLAP